MVETTVSLTHVDGIMYRRRNGIRCQTHSRFVGMTSRRPHVRHTRSIGIWWRNVAGEEACTSHNPLERGISRVEPSQFIDPPAKNDRDVVPPNEKRIKAT